MAKVAFEMENGFYVETGQCSRQVAENIGFKLIGLPEDNFNKPQLFKKFELYELQMYHNLTFCINRISVTRFVITTAN